MTPTHSSTVSNSSSAKGGALGLGFALLQTFAALCGKLRPVSNSSGVRSLRCLGMVAISGEVDCPDIAHLRLQLHGTPAAGCDT